MEPLSQINPNTPLYLDGPIGLNQSCHGPNNSIGLVQMSQTRQSIYEAK